MEQPDSLLERMIALYRRCNSYLEQGKATYHDAQGVEKLSTAFRFYLLRPTSFRLEWQDARGGGLFCFDGTKGLFEVRGRTVSSQSFDAYEPMVARAVGLSGGAAGVLFSLVDPSWSGRTYKELRNVQVSRQDEPLESRLVVTGSTYLPEDTRLWLDDKPAIHRIWRRRVLSHSDRQRLYSLSRQRAVAAGREFNRSEPEGEREFTTEYSFEWRRFDEEIPLELFTYPDSNWN